MEKASQLWQACLLLTVVLASVVNTSAQMGTPTTRISPPTTILPSESTPSTNTISASSSVPSQIPSLQFTAVMSTIVVTPSPTTSAPTPTPVQATGPETQDDDCHPPCQNGGRCVRFTYPGQTAGKCLCADPYFGAYCEIKRRPRRCRRRCQNGGVCVYMGSDTTNNVNKRRQDKTRKRSWRCRCPFPYSGRRCSVLLGCTRNCKNGRTCYIDYTNRNRKCRCRPTFYGPTCARMRKQFCYPKCRKGTRCIRTRKGHRCVKPTFWSGVGNFLDSLLG